MPDLLALLLKGILALVLLRFLWWAVSEYDGRLPGRRRRRK